MEITGCVLDASLISWVLGFGFLTEEEMAGSNEVNLNESKVLCCVICVHLLAIC